ncbi:hypothetical protein [Streptomyces sp. Je 1-4]|uniref:hypothetical protein n=1 Tax=Streptomyces explomaris TaxID=2981351 RepID=UPI003985C36F
MPRPRWSGDPPPSQESPCQPASATTRLRAPSAAARAPGLTKVYGEGETRVVALDSVTVEFGRGRFTAIMGPSGSGKCWS